LWPYEGAEAAAFSASVASPDLGHLYQAAGFEPRATNASVIAVISDIHIDPRYLQTTNIDDRLVEQINALDPLPDLLVVCGDLATSHSKSYGAPRHEVHMEVARWELARAMEELQRFSPEIDLRVIPGNHDTDAQEISPDLWYEVLPDCPAYQSLELAGMKVLLLNGRHSGDFDPDQEAWLRDQMDTWPPDRDVLAFVHQPTFHMIDTHRGIKRVFAEVFGPRQGRLWAVSGHVHRFGNEVYRLGGTLAVQTIVTTANPAAWCNGGTNPGFALICIADGAVVARVVKDVKSDLFELLEIPENLPVRGMIWPYETVDLPILALEEGAYDRTAYVESVTSNDTGAWWAYLGQIVFRLPLGAYGGKATHVTVLGSADRSQYIAFRFADQPDPSLPGWIEVPRPEAASAVYEVSIPESLRGAEEVYFEMYSETDRFWSGIRLGGIGLSSTQTNLLPVEQWMSRHFMSIMNTGTSAMAACPAADGICNLVKYAFGLDPLAPDRRYIDLESGASAGGLPCAYAAGTGSLARVGIVYPRRPAYSDPGVTYRVQVSEDLSGWFDDPSLVQTSAPAGEDWEHVTACQESPPARRYRFYRVEVELTEDLLPQ
jgi:predicted phosphodiesterase